MSAKDFLNNLKSLSKLSQAWQAEVWNMKWYQYFRLNSKSIDKILFQEFESRLVY